MAREKSNKRNSATRGQGSRQAAGDAAPVAGPPGIEAFVVGAAVEAAREARPGAMRHILHKMPYATKDTPHIGNLDPLIVGRAKVVYERGEKHGAPIP